MGSSANLDRRHCKKRPDARKVFSTRAAQSSEATVEPVLFEAKKRVTTLIDNVGCDVSCPNQRLVEEFSQR